MERLHSNQRTVDTLPRPSGKYVVGVTYLSFVDVKRKEMFDSQRESPRELTVKVWYPADQPFDGEPYLLEAEATFATKYLQFPARFKDLKTNAGRDVPVASREDRYPVLIFSHGWGEHYAQNTILMEELASHGYIVFSLSHHYECKFTSYPDGRLIHIEMDNPRLQKMMNEQMHPKAMTLFETLQNATGDEERVQVFQEMSMTLPMVLTESPAYWAEDIAFLMDQLNIMDGGDGCFHKKMDLDRIGVFGMSLGGLATSVISSTDRRIKAAVNMDGGLSTASLDVEYEMPFMFFNSQRYLGCGPLFLRQTRQDGYSLSVRGAGHYNFSDYSVYPVPSIQFLLGPIDGDRMIDMMNGIIRAFFDKYLKQEPEIDILKIAQKYEEIDIVTHIESQ